MVVKDITKDDTITVFGAQGRTGAQTVRLALQQGYMVNAFVYKNKYILKNHYNLKIFEGNARNFQDVNEAIKGSTCVINIIAPKLFDYKNHDISLVATKNIIRAMTEQGVARYFGQCGAWATEHLNYASIPMRIGFKVFFPLISVYKFKRQEDLVIKNSNLCWTIVRCPILNNHAAKWPVHIYNNGYKCKPFELPQISRNSVARFYINNLNNQAIHNKAIDIMPK